MSRTEATAPRTTTPLPGRLLLGAVAGFLAGVVFIAVNSWFVSTQGRPPLAPFKLISTLVLPAQAPAQGNVQVGMAVHAVLSAIFGMLFGLATPLFKSNGTLALAGVLYGGTLYVVNFLIFGTLVFPQFRQATNQPFELAVHIVFGYLVALFFYSSGVRRNEPFVDL